MAPNEGPEYRAHLFGGYGKRVKIEIVEMIFEAYGNKVGENLLIVDSGFFI